MGNEHLIVGGGQKCGTTWIQHVLDENPRFFCPPTRPEIHFFDRCYQEGFPFYESLYRKADPSQVTVDVTPDYLGLGQWIAGRIKEYENYSSQPVKLLFVLRDPVERLVSAYKMRFRKGQIEHPVEIPEAPGLLDYGLYYRQLCHFFSHFPENRIKLFLFEEIFSEETGFFEELGDFVGLDEPVQTSYRGKKLNAGYYPKTRLLSATTSLSGRLLRKLGAGGLIHHVKRTKGFHWLQALNTDRNKEAILSEQTEQIRHEYTPYYQQDVESLSRLFNNRALEKSWPRYFRGGGLPP